MCKILVVILRGKCLLNDPGIDGIIHFKVDLKKVGYGLTMS
jgi:hypothetical protein